jgi:hypothetical protein
MRSSARGTFSGVVLLLMAFGVKWSLQAQPQAPAAHVALVDEYCLSCHDADDKKGDLDLDALLTLDVTKHPDVWEKVVRKLRARQMPPVGRKRPDAATYDAVVASLETTLDAAAKARPNPGRTGTIRRLTRTEYRNAIRDLLALDVDVAALLPPDESSYGFDNVTVGDLSPTLLDRYLSPLGARAGRRAARRSACRRTSRRRITSKDFHSARAAARSSITRSLAMANTNSRSA